MLKKISRLFGFPWFCKHNFSVVNKINIHVPGQRMPVGKEYHVLCSLCGEVYARKITPS
jgi:hypothetical protein